MCSNRVVKVKKLPEKVKLAILDKDLKARTFKKFPITSDGTKIDVVNAGKGYFMPKFDNDSFIELPYRHPLSFWKQSWARVYVAVRGADACINFKTGEVPDYDPKQIVKAARAEVIKNYGKGKLEIPWYLTAMLAINLILVILISHTLGVF